MVTKYLADQSVFFRHQILVMTNIVFLGNQNLLMISTGFLGYQTLDLADYQ